MCRKTEEDIQNQAMAIAVLQVFLLQMNQVCNFGDKLQNVKFHDKFNFSIDLQNKGLSCKIHPVMSVISRGFLWTPKPR